MKDRLVGVQMRRCLDLENRGRAETSFAWDVPSLGPHFSVTPTTGSVLPGKTCALELTFKPKSVGATISVPKVSVHSESSWLEARPLTIECG